MIIVNYLLYKYIYNIPSVLYIKSFTLCQRIMLLSMLVDLKIDYIQTCIYIHINKFMLPRVSTYINTVDHFNSCMTCEIENCERWF